MDRNEMIRRKLNRCIEEAAGKTAAFVQRLSAPGPYPVLDALSWAEDVALLNAIAVHAQRVLTIEESGKPLDVALNAVMERVTESLLTDQYRGTSSSAFHNATEAAQRAGAARFLDAIKMI